VEPGQDPRAKAAPVTRRHGRRTLLDARTLGHQLNQVSPRVARAMGTGDWREKRPGWSKWALLEPPSCPQAQPRTRYSLPERVSTRPDWLCWGVLPNAPSRSLVLSRGLGREGSWSWSWLFGLLWVTIGYQQSIAAKPRTATGGRMGC
jgi:hypothetical protein